MYDNNSSNKLVQTLLKATQQIRPYANIYSPQRLLILFKEITSLDEEYTVVIVGTQSNRKIIIYNKRLNGFIISLDGSACSKDIFENKLNIQIPNPNYWWSPASFTQDTIFRLTRPVIKLLSLCHNTIFPLPRFALGLHDLAKAIRYGGFGQVSLIDMQLGSSIDSMVKACVEDQVDVIGISLTFGQQDLLVELLNKLLTTCTNINIVVGGSLASLNSKEILRKFPQIIVAKSEGEVTICDVVKYWRGECSIHDINDIEYVNNDKINISKISILTKHENAHTNIISTSSNKKSISYNEYKTTRTPKNTKKINELPIPELDLITQTLSSHGVMLLESSRGCSFSCSFCPRDHKGKWYTTDMPDFQSFLRNLGIVFDEHSNSCRKIFFVDEEFFGYSSNTENRVLNIASSLSKHKFHFETSARLDQIYRPQEDHKWHTKRLKVWKELVKLGMDRCLFGVESGVNSILQRFNKKITSEQNVTAIRLLSLANIPVRFTYITFDPLMNMNELIDSYRFQGRTDLWLNSINDGGLDSLISIALDDVASNKLNIGVPLYESISYMLVSLECLIGSNYLKKISSLNLLGTPNYLMGRQDVRYSDPIIGILSKHAQMWIDRNFALDYTLKSLSKVMDKSLQLKILEIRKIFKSYSYRFLGVMLVVVNNDPSLEAHNGDGRSVINVATKAGWKENYSIECLERILPQVMDWLFDKLRNNIEKNLQQYANHLDTDSRHLIDEQYSKWAESVGWNLINDHY